MDCHSLRRERQSDASGADPQFEDRMPLVPKTILDADMLPFPARFTGAELPTPRRAPNVGEHTDDVLRTAAGYDDTRIQALREAGVVF